MLKHALLGLLAAQTALSSRFVMYIDQYVAILLSVQTPTYGVLMPNYS